MRKLLLLSLLTAFSVGTSFAQNIQPQKRFQLGVIGGKTILGSKTEKVFFIKAGGGFAGIDLGYLLLKKNPNLSLHLQPNWETFSQKTENFLEQTTTLKFTSVNIPILIRYTAPVRPWIHPFIEVGGAYKIRLNYSNEIIGSHCGIADCSNGIFASSQLTLGNGRGAALLVGVGAEFRWGVIKIPVSIRLSEGLGTYLMKGANRRGDNFTYSNPETRTLQIVTGITF